PAGQVWQGMGSSRSGVEKPGAAWTYRGQELPYLTRLLAADQLQAALDGAPLRMRPAHEAALADSAAVQRTSIAVEKINGPILLLSGADDQIWPSGPQCEMIMQRLKQSRHPYVDRHVCYAGAGHFINPGRV